VKQDISDERLQEFLDGRLANGERAEIEALLEQDEELARRVEAWREIGRALRQDAGELPPGFHARARERFEQTVRARPPWGLRVLSWEAAGLAAAVVLAAVLFVPEVLRNRDLRSVPPRTAESSVDETRADRPAPSEPVARPKRQAPEALGEAAAPDDAVRITDDRMGPPTPPGLVEEDLAQVEGRRERGAAATEPAWAPAPQDTAPPAIEKEAGEAGDRAGSVPPPTSPGRGRHEPAARADADRAAEPQRIPSRQKKAERAVKAAAPTEAFSRAEVSADLEGVASQALDVPVVELPADASIENGIQIVDRADEWETWLAGPTGPALSGLGGYDADRRLVLVGRPSGADCSSVTVQQDERGYRVRLARAGVSAGCALLLPRDGLPVALDVATEE
jgi:hypothetical protein